MSTPYYNTKATPPNSFTLNVMCTHQMKSSCTTSQIQNQNKYALSPKPNPPICLQKRKTIKHLPITKFLHLPQKQCTSLHIHNLTKKTLSSSLNSTISTKKHTTKEEKKPTSHITLNHINTHIHTKNQPTFLAIINPRHQNTRKQTHNHHP